MRSFIILMCLILTIEYTFANKDDLEPVSTMETSSSNNLTVPDGFVPILGSTNTRSSNKTNSMLAMELNTNFNKLNNYTSIRTSNLTSNSAAENAPPKIGLQRFISSSGNNGIVASNSISNDIPSTDPLLVNKMQSSAANNGTSNSGSTVSVTLLILISLIVVSSLIAIILTALFVMRRRFSTWRLNAAGSTRLTNVNANGSAPGSENNDGKMSHQGDSSENGSTLEDEEAKCITINESEKKKAKLNESENNKAAEAASKDTSCHLTCVENKQAMADLLNKNEAAMVVDVAKKDQEAINQDLQASPSSASPLINTTNDSTAAIQANNAVNAEEAVENVQQSDQQINSLNNKAQSQDNLAAACNDLKQQEVSSSSLIVNVLSELSESVACKLASTKSPSKSALNCSSNDPEKQPLNE